jgi:hypothetical protein
VIGEPGRALEIPILALGEPDGVLASGDLT